MNRSPASTYIPSFVEAPDMAEPWDEGTSCRCMAHFVLVTQSDAETSGLPLLASDVAFPMLKKAHPVRHRVL